jgi:hypothetical protein
VIRDEQKQKDSFLFNCSLLSCKGLLTVHFYIISVFGIHVNLHLRQAPD